MPKLCKNCRIHKNDTDEPFGAYFPFEPDNICRNCKQELSDVDIDYHDYCIIVSASNTIQFLEAMLELKQKDIVEYQMKISQLRSQQTWRDNASKPKCPRCKSTAITAGQRGYSIVWGFWGSGDTVNRCSNCGHKWKPSK